jgi:acyl-CoA synthetase (NDP forming)
LAGTRAEVYGAVISELLASDHCDLVVAVAGSSAQFQPEITVGPIARADRHGKPLAVFIAPHAEAGLKQLADAGVAGYRTPESCADGLRAWQRWRVPVEPPAADAAAVASARRILSALGGRRPNEVESGALFAALGIPCAESTVIRTPGEPVAIAFPVVAKVLSAEVPHKTDAGGVVLGVPDAAALATAAATILARVAARCPHAAIDGILVQRMERGLAEVIVGYRRDPEVGPVVVLGVGGVLAEIQRDIAIRVAPTTLDEAWSMIDEVRGLAVIRGYRGLPRGDCEALATAVVAMSQLAAVDGPAVAEAEINPLLVKADGAGVVAVDGLVVLQQA